MKAVTTAPAAKVPVATPAASGVAVALAVAVVAFGTVLGRDALIDGGAITGTPWITPAWRFFDGLTAQSWMIAAGLALAALGGVLVIVALMPRTRTHRPLAAAPDTWIATRDIRRVARGAATEVTGVGAATSTGSSRRVTVTVIPLAGFDTADLTKAVQSNVSQALAPLANAPRVTTRIREQDPS